jgi:hypothetical protein
MVREEGTRGALVLHLGFRPVELAARKGHDDEQ